MAVKPLAAATREAFVRRMEREGVPSEGRRNWLKWAMFYLDFCGKYRHAAREEARIGAFVAKLAAKGQDASQRAEARKAVELLTAARPRRPAAASAPAADARFSGSSPRASAQVAGSAGVRRHESLRRPINAGMMGVEAREGA